MKMMTCLICEEGRKGGHVFGALGGVAGCRRASRR